MANLPPADLHARAEYVSGQHKPLYMMEGLDASYGVILFVSYHASAGTAGVLSHTYNPAAIAEVRIDGTIAGESGINALVAAACNVPIALVTGDQYVGPEATPFCPEVEVVQVKHALGRTSAHSLHPDVACARIRGAARRAVQRGASLTPPRFATPTTLEVDFRTEEMAEMVTVLGARHTSVRTATFTDDDPLHLYRIFVAALYLTRPLGTER